MSFGVNIFEFLEDENDPDKSAKKLAPKEKVVSSDKPTAVQNKNTKPAKAQTETNKAEQPQPQQVSGGTRKTEKHQGGSPGSPAERRPRLEKDPKPADSKADGEDSADNRSRNRTKGPRGDKNADKPRTVPPTFEGRPKRQFDRRSGTGRGKEVKKGGSGKGNWGSWEEGSPQQTEGRKEETVTEQPPTENEGEATAADASEPKDTESKEQKIEEKEPEVVEKSLEEYLNELKSKEPHLPLPQQRKPGEGVDESQWREFTPLKRDDEEEALPSKPKKNAKSEPKKEVVPVSLQFQEPRRPRRDDRDQRSDQRSDQRNDQRKKGFGGNKNTTPNKRASNKSAPNFSADSFPSLTPATKA